MATGEALVCKLKNIFPIEGADKIVQANLFGETIIISKDYIEGTLGLLFDCESLLDPDFCKYNNLYRHQHLNRDTTQVGYLEDSRRIRPIKLRGVKCSALWMPIYSLNYIGSLYPQEGTQIKEWSGKPICDKYVRPIRGNGKNNKQIKKVQQVLNFAEHLDTDQLLRNLHKINIGDKIIVTSKLHGTSARAGLLPCIDLTWKGRFFRWLGLNLKNEYKFVVGSRHCLKSVQGEKIEKKDSYYIENIWKQSADQNFLGKLIPGETVFYEIVGFLPSGESIMPRHDNKKLEKFLDKQEYKDFIQKFGQETIFHYGCRDNLKDDGFDENGNISDIRILKSSVNAEYKIFVYRITLTTEHGQSIDYTWEQVKSRCEEMGVNHVPQLDNFLIDPDRDFYTEEKYWLELTEEDDINFPQHLNEGICVRVENGKLRPDIYKNKRYAFKVLEGIIKDTTEFADMEESN